MLRGKPGYEHLNEPLHILVEAELPVEIIEARLMQAREILEDLLKPVVMFHLQPYLKLLHQFSASYIISLSLEYRMNHRTSSRNSSCESLLCSTGHYAMKRRTCPVQCPLTIVLEWREQRQGGKTRDLFAWHLLSEGKIHACESDSPVTGVSSCPMLRPPIGALAPRLLFVVVVVVVVSKNKFVWKCVFPCYLGGLNQLKSAVVCTPFWVIIWVGLCMFACLNKVENRNETLY